MATLRLIIILLVSNTLGLVTLESVREITNVTKACTREVVDVSRLRPETWTGNVGQAQVVEIHRDGDDEELEDLVAAALNTVDRKLLEVLNVPLGRDVKMRDPRPQCKGILQDYHSFLGSTSRFLYAIHEKQQVHKWDGNSPVFHALAWLQALWASRKYNEQQRSFIEQQMALYSSTGCFENSQEVLRRDVELVEFMNGLLDNFE